MTPHRWHQIHQLLDQLLDLPTHQHHAFLLQACPDEPSLRGQLLEALHHPTRAEALLLRLHRRELHALRDPQPGDRIGPYLLLEEHARGGMGSVFRARRADGAFEQTVAVKLVRPGPGAQALHQRFLAERQILARLQHPNIARLYDGGLSAEGRPYFVMEFIDGVALTDYCDGRRLGVAARLGLFLEVCRAVQYAHQRLVVHRDLKPSNILVSEAGSGRARVKLLDFGIAKVLTEEGLTRTGVPVLTPAYAAPEQLTGEAITTATDVYALGVLLYELLVGRRPYGGATQTSQAATAARLRGTTVAGLRRRLRGDLNTIVVKALEPEPERRYQSAQQLLDDLQRHLQGLPVRARRETVRYRVGKFVGRHRWAVLATAVALVAVLGFGVVTALQSARLRVQAERLAQEASQAEAVKGFLVGLFEVSDPGQSRGREVTARSLLEAGVGRVEALEAAPLVQAEMLGVLGVVYRQLGMYGRSRGLLERALALRRAELGEEHEAVAEAMCELGDTLLNLEESEEAEALYRHALVLYRSLGLGEHLGVAKCLSNLGIALSNQGVYVKAEEVLRTALAMRRKLLGDEHSDVAEGLRNLAWMLKDKGGDDLEEAESHCRAALAIYRKLLGEEHPGTLETLAKLETILYSRGAYDEAERLQRKIYEVRRRLLGEKHPSTVFAIDNLGTLAYQRGAYHEADSLFQRGLASWRKLFGDEHPYVAYCLYWLGRVRHRQGAFEEAEILHRKALAMRRKVLGNEHPDAGYSVHHLGDLLLDRGRYEEAEALLREGLHIHEKHYAEGDVRTAGVHMSLGRCLTASGHLEEAEGLLQASLATYQAQERAGTIRVGRKIEQARRALTELHIAQKRRTQETLPYHLAREESP